MASPVAHALVGAGLGALLGRADTGRWPREALGLAALAGAAADLDFLPGLLVGDPSRYHHWATHSLLAVVACALVAAWAAPARLGPAVHRAAILGAAYASHLALDLVTVDRTHPRGIPLLWPLSTVTYQSPVTVFRDLNHGATWEAFINWHNALAVLIELVVVAAPLCAVWAWRRRAAAGRPVVA